MKMSQISEQVVIFMTRAMENQRVEQLEIKIHTGIFQSDLQTPQPFLIAKMSLVYVLRINETTDLQSNKKKQTTSCALRFLIKMKKN